MKTNNAPRRGFTVVELLVVVGILLVLTIGIIYFLNPAALQSQGRDTNRVSDLTTLSQSLALYHETSPAGTLGTSGIMYVSIPDPSATSTAGDQCQGLGLSSAPSGFVYHCAASSTYRSTNGTGWVPVNFSAISSVSLATLPIDPVNSTSSGEYYVYVASGTYYEFLGNPESPKTTSSSLDQGNGLAIVFPSAGGGSAGPIVWIADTGNNRVEAISTAGVYQSQFGSAGSGNGQLSSPTDLAIDGSGNVWVVDTGNNRVEEFSSSGTYLSQFGSTGSGDGQFNYAQAITIDGSGNIWVLDAGNSYGGSNRVEKFSSSGSYISQFGSTGSGDGQFWDPYALAVDGSGNILVVDDGNYRVEKFSSSGSYISKFGSTGSGDGQFESPEGIAVDGSGNIWVVDRFNHRVEEFSSSGTYLSQFGSYGYGNGQFYYPNDIAVDGSGNIWVDDDWASKIQEFSSSGTYLSQFGSTGSGDGQLNSPGGMKIK